MKKLHFFAVFLLLISISLVAAGSDSSSDKDGGPKSGISQADHNSGRRRKRQINFNTHDEEDPEEDCDEDDEAEYDDEVPLDGSCEEEEQFTNDKKTNADVQNMRACSLRASKCFQWNERDRRGGGHRGRGGRGRGRCKGQWSEWSEVRGATCSDTCGRCGKIAVERFCEPEGCKCRGERSMMRECNWHVCFFPRYSCCKPYVAGTKDGRHACVDP